MDNSVVAGVDIGGSHITVALVDLKKKTILDHTWRRMHIDSLGNAQTILNSWQEVILDSFRAHNMNPTAIGIAMPGPFDYEQGISLMKNQNKYDALYDLNIRELLSDRLLVDQCDIKFTNDAACFLQGEVFAGLAKDADKVLGLTLGTGFGSAFAVGGKAVDADLWCAPFKEGIAEDYLSTRWFVKRYSELAGGLLKDVKELVALDNHYTRILFSEFGNNLAEFLAPVVRAEHTELIVLGGNIANAYHLFATELKAKLRQEKINVQIGKTILGENATLLGAASYCLFDLAYLDVID